MTLTFEQARACVLREVPAPALNEAGIESVALAEADHRVLAEEIRADRDYPPFPRSARDGFAIRAADVPGELRVIGEVRAGQSFPGSVGQGEALEIMTGAPVPDGADAVVMIEHTTREGSAVKVGRFAKGGDNITPTGEEARAGVVVLQAETPLGYAEIALLAMVGCARVRVFRRPRVAILPTGDEIVEAGEQHLGPAQIRNSNAAALAAQVRRAGGVPEVLPIARDNYESTSALVSRGLDADLLLLSGGVSAGKYDIVERVLADAGAEFFFDSVLIQPGKPVVFGRVCRESVTKFVFGLPGNPASTMVTFELFARAAIERMQGVMHPPLRLLRAKLTREFRHKPGLTRFLPARLSADGSTVEPEPWKGSGDVAALARANAFLVAEPDRESWAAGEDIRVLLK
ncbi:MAG TPA: gephyrin-like molybdotransferase Glp [Bryobacteraceae bacterium]|nr:gephyrin-like molybdotransferase Glp [Bryobacteraceae bacterium]